MKYTKQILLFFLTLAIFSIISSPAYAVPGWLRRVEIRITPQMPESYQGTQKEFRDDPTYLQGEQAVFNITFDYVIRIWTIRIRIPVDVPAKYIRATFPNSERQVNLTHIFWGL